MRCLIVDDDEILPASFAQYDNFLEENSLSKDLILIQHSYYSNIETPLTKPTDLMLWWQNVIELQE